MSLDEELRQAERAVARGEPGAEARLEELRRRAGRLIAVPIVVPPLGESAPPSGVVVGEVRAAVGARVKKDEPLVLLEQDKVCVELVAPADGFVTAVAVAPGDETQVGHELVQLACTELPDDDPWALLAVARAAHEAGQVELALTALERAQPGASCGRVYWTRDAGVEAGRARVYEALGRREDALSCWRAVLELARGEALRAEAAGRVAALEGG